jgi:outer membrane protein TolC
VIRASLIALACCALPAVGRAQEPTPAPAQAPATPLTLDEVLRASAAHAPQIVEALARVRQAEGRALSAEGSFDTVFDVDGQSRVTGYYDGTYVEGRATRPLRDNGGYLYGGYRVSRGDFPIYEDRAFTNRLGELKVGALYSLIRDRLVDERRTRVGLAASDIDVARLEGEMVAIGVQARAIAAYQNWVAAGSRLRVYRGLYALAEERRGALGRQVALGARPAIILTENEQNVVRRRALVVRTEQEFEAAANTLSLFYRDADGRRVLVGPERLPPSLPEPPTVRRPVGPVDRPDLRTVLARIDQSLAKLALAENDLKPRLDLRGELSRDFGSEGLGGPSRSGSDTIVGVKFSVPLERRQARGRIAEARAEIDGLQTRRRFLEDQIAVEVEGISIAVGASERLAAIADEERALAERMAAAERRRFEAGASDFFLVNQREEAAADAAVRQVDATLRVAAAQAEFAAAVADRRALGLNPAPTEIP